MSNNHPPGFIGKDERAAFRSAIEALEAVLPIAAVVVHPSGSASKGDEWAANVTIKLADGREFVHTFAGWESPDQELLETHILLLDAVVEAADIALWGAMSEAAVQAARTLTTNVEA